MYHERREHLALSGVFVAKFTIRDAVRGQKVWLTVKVGEQREMREARTVRGERPWSHKITFQAHVGDDLIMALRTNASTHHVGLFYELVDDLATIDVMARSRDVP